MSRDQDIKKLSITYQLSAEAPRIFSILSDELQWPSETEARVLKRQPNSRVVVALADFTRIELNLTPTPEGCEVSLVHDLLKSSDDVKFYSQTWNAWFKLISNRVSN